jgi:hypothetical protein
VQPAAPRTVDFPEERSPCPSVAHQQYQELHWWKAPAGAVTDTSQVAIATHHRLECSRCQCTAVSPSTHQQLRSGEQTNGEPTRQPRIVSRREKCIPNTAWWNDATDKSVSKLSGKSTDFQRRQQSLLDTLQPDDWSKQAGARCTEQSPNQQRQLRCQAWS